MRSIANAFAFQTLEGILRCKHNWRIYMLYVHVVSSTISSASSSNVYFTTGISVYSFKFAQSYFRPTRIRDWFAQSWIRLPSNFLIKSLICNSIGPVLDSRSGHRAKIKRGRNFPCIQYAFSQSHPEAFKKEAIRKWSHFKTTGPSQYCCI